MNVSLRSSTLCMFFVWLVMMMVSKFFVINFFVGSIHTKVSCFAALMPLIGSFCAFPGVCGILTGWVAISCLFGSLPLTLGAPTVLATLSWSISAAQCRSGFTKILDLIVHAVIPLGCLVFFVIHPNVGYAWPYALYWLIPPALLFLRLYTNKHTILTSAIASTFVAHAVGSIIWLLMVPMRAEQWLGLIWLVAIERLILAGLSTLSVFGLCFLATCLQHFLKNKRLKVDFNNDCFLL